MKKLLWTILFYSISQLSLAQSISDTLKVAYTNAPPFIIEDATTPKGINIWLWKQIAKDLELNYELQQMSFSEMLKALQEGTIDVCINPLTITSERSKKMDFTHSYYASNSTIAIYEASFFQKVSQFFGSIFNLKFLSGFLSLLLIIFFFGIIAWYFERKVNPQQFRPGWQGIWDGLWWSVVTMTTVGYGDKTPKSRGGKMIALLWMFSGLLFISGITASVASMLTVNKLKANHEGFSDFKDYAVGCIQNSSTNDFLEEQFFKDIHGYPNVTKGLNDLSEHKIDAFLYDEPILKYRINQDEAFEHLRILPIEFDLQLYAFALPKNRTALEEVISQKILEITESMKWRVILNEYNLSEL